MLPLAGRVAEQPHDEHNIHHATQDGTREGAGPAARAKSMQPSPDAPGTGARLRELSRLAVSTLRVAAPSGRGKGGGARAF